MTFDPALSAMMAEPWSNGACRGYVIMAMENCGFSSDDIRRMMAELRLSLRAALLSARERRSEHGCLWTGQENGGGVLYFILTWSEARGQHRLGAALLRFPTICGKRILFLIRRFYREINGKGTGTNEKR